MTAPRRLCLTCGAPTTDTRCDACRRVRESARNARRPWYSTEWRRLSKAARQSQPWCTQCGATDDLTVDHVVPRSLDGWVVVLCRSCNSSKGGAK